jgi:hypothetical protein
VYRGTAAIRITSATFGFKLSMASKLKSWQYSLADLIAELRERLPRTALAGEVIEAIASGTGGG